MSSAGCYGVTYVGRTSILASRMPRTMFICTCPHHAHGVAQGKNGCSSQRFQISLRVLQMIIILTDTIAAVQSCPPSMMYDAQLGIRATTTVVLFMCCSFRTHFKGAGQNMAIGCNLILHAGTAYRESRRGRDILQRGWLKYGNRLQIALACRHSGHRVSCTNAARSGS